MVREKLIQMWSPNKEVCGILTIDDEIIPIRNCSNTPIDSFILDKREWLSLLNNGIIVKAIYHTHPTNNIEPSAKDLESFSKLRYDMIIIGQSEINWIKKGAR